MSLIVLYLGTRYDVGLILYEISSLHLPEFAPGINIFEFHENYINDDVIMMSLIVIVSMKIVHISKARKVQHADI